MAVAVPNQWNATGGTVDIQQAISPTPGNWLVAIVVWTTTTTAVQPVINFTDPSRNVWWLLATRQVQASETGLFTGGPLNVQVWACPAVSFTGWDQMRVYTAIQQITGSDLGSVCVKLVELSGMGNGFLTVDSVSVTSATAATSVTVSAPAPSGGTDCVQVAAAACNLNYSSFTTSAGWAQLSNVVNGNPNIGLCAAWREATTAGSATFTLSTAQNWSAVMVSIRQTGVVPAQTNPNWPLVETQLGLGYSLSTPPSGVWWTTLTNTVRSISTKRGMPYELGVAQSEPTDLLIRNNDGALTPKASVSGTATANGSRTTFVCADADGNKFNVGDFVQIAPAALNPNYSFESGTTGWTGVGGTLTTTTSVGAIGTYAGQMTPTGTTATVQVITASHVAVAAGVTYAFSAWVRCAVARAIELRAIWYDGSNTFLDNDIVQVNVAANTWVFAMGTFTAPLNAASADIAPTMTGTPPASNVMYLDTVSVTTAPETTAFKVASKASVSGTTTITFAPADGSGGGALFATRTGDTLNSTPVDVYTPYRVLATWNGKRHYLTAGWAERWPQAWTSDGLVGEVTMTGTGVLANLTATNPTCLAGNIMRRNPYSYWPLSDAQGASTAQNLSGRGTAVLTVTTSTSGSAGTNSFGTSTQGVTDSILNGTQSLLGDPGNGWEQTGITSTQLTNHQGAALVASDSGFPSIANGVTLFFVRYVSANDDTNITTNPTVAIVKNTDSSAGATDAVIKYSFQTGTTNTGLPVITWWDRSTHSATTVQCTSGLTFDVTEFVSGAIAFNKTTWRAYAGGQLSGSGSCNLADKFSLFQVAGEAGSQFFNGLCCNGIYAHVAVFDRMLSDGEISDLDASLNGHSGDEYTANRVQRKLDTIHMATGRTISTDGGRICAVEGTDGSTIADINNTIAAYEDAWVFEDAGANYQYRPPELYAHQSTRATLGERTDLGEIPYQGGLSADFDATYVYNSVTATNTTLSYKAFSTLLASTLYVAADSTSQSKYGIRTLTRDTRLYYASDVTHLAQRLLSRYKGVQARISQVDIDPASNPNAFLFCLTVEVCDKVTINRRPLNGQLVTFNCIVLEVAHSIQAGAWKTTLTLAPAP